MDYSNKEKCKIRQLITELCGEPVTVQQAIETYEEMMDLDDISESYFYIYK